MNAQETLRSPFPWFGGKSRAAPLVWSALGRVDNYVEPFFGSGAVLLARPRETWRTPEDPGTETVNDASRFLANFWRAVAHAPDDVAAGCDWPVNETDLHARHKWLVKRLPDLAALLDGDPRRVRREGRRVVVLGAVRVDRIGVVRRDAGRSGHCPSAALGQCRNGRAPQTPARRRRGARWTPRPASAC